MENSNLEKPILQKVEEALQSIRPYLEADGGDVKILNITEEGIVKLELLGACGTCPMSEMTLKAGVEEAIKRAVPDINGVEAINVINTQHQSAQSPGNYL